MKQAIFLKNTWILFLFVFFCNSYLHAQTPEGNALFISPGNNSCNAGSMPVGDAGWGAFVFPVPTGLTLAELNYLETDYRNLETSPWANVLFIVSLQTPCAWFEIVFEAGNQVLPNPAWINSGNVASPSSMVKAFSECHPYYLFLPFEDVQALYGSFPVSAITLLAAGLHGHVFSDNTIINNRTYNYDDCDGDGLLDIYDCDPAHGGNNKVRICHNGQSICVALTALQTHLNHGDYMGSCSSFAPVADILSAKEEKIIELNLYPNPAANQINISNSNNKHLGTVSIYDITGKIIYTNFIASSKAIISVSNFSPGVYYLKSDQMKKAIQFVKQ